MPVEYAGICFCCGHATTKYEVGAMLSGQIIDMQAGPWVGNLEVVVCGDCWRKSKEKFELGIDHAIEARKELARQDELDKRKRDDGLTP